jgi:DNA-binding response OmpR family regulator
MTNADAVFSGCFSEACFMHHFLSISPFALVKHCWMFGPSMKHTQDMWHKRILLIDDDAWIRDSMAVFFESEGSCFLALETAEEGLNELARRDYDIVICDYRLPGMDGLSFFKLIRGKDSVKLLITAYGTDTLPDEARAAGVDGYLVKPLDMKAIESELRRLVQGRHAVPRGPEKPKERGNANRAH